MTVNVNVTAQKSKRILEYRPAHFEKQIHPPRSGNKHFFEVSLTEEFFLKCLNQLLLQNLSVLSRNQRKCGP